MQKENGRELTAAEKHEQARAYALSGTLSKFQIAKRQKALQEEQQQQRMAMLSASSMMNRSFPKKPKAGGAADGMAKKRVPTKASQPSAKARSGNKKAVISQHANIKPSATAAPVLPSTSLQLPPLNNGIMNDPLLEDPFPTFFAVNDIDTAAVAVAIAGDSSGDEDDDDEEEDDDHPEWPPVESCDWGYVYICGGPFKGRFGYYDDNEYCDDDLENEDSDVDIPPLAVVYFDRPLGDDGYNIPLKYLKKPPPNSGEKWVPF